MTFTDRTDGGEQLADRLIEAGVDADLVCAIPRGGLPVGRAVADRLGVPLDVVVATKLGAPSNPELAIGAVAGDGSYWLNDKLVDQLRVDDKYIQREREHDALARHVGQWLTTAVVGDFLACNQGDRDRLFAAAPG